MNSMKYCDLEAVLHFIYSGQVDLPATQLNTFLTSAKQLQIEGLDEAVQPNTTQTTVRYLLIHSG